MPKPEKKKWWDEKWYWAFCIISAPFWVFLVDYLISGSIHLARDIPMAVMLPIGVLVAYYVRYHARGAAQIHLFKMLAIGGGASLGFFIGTFLSIGLGFLKHPFPLSDLLIAFLIIIVSIVTCAIIADVVMKRRGYLPFA